MKLKNQIVMNADGLKEYNFNNLPDFIKSVLQLNGGDYETIYQRMLALLQFISGEQYKNIKLDWFNLSKINEVYEDFFSDSDKVINPKFFLKEGKAFYEKVSDAADRVELNIQTQKRAVAVLKNSENQKPALYFGDRNDLGDDLDVRGDAGLLFADSKIVFHDEFNACFEGWSWLRLGHHAEFAFNHLNQLQQVICRSYHPVLETWSKDQIFNLAAEHTLPQTPKQATQDQGLTK